MGDPRRLRSESPSPAALLLRSAPRLEPPPAAKGEVWRRLQAASAIAAASPATQAAAGSKIAGKAFRSGLLNWGAVGGPAILVAAHFAAHTDRRMEEPPAATESFARSSRAPEARLPPATPASETAMRHPLPPGPASSPAASPVSSLRAETAMLGVARERLSAGACRDALDEVTKLAARFPRGALTQEREVVAIGALAGLDDRQALSARAAAFLQRYPDSPYAVHVRHFVER
jgi:hypothetical protein